MMKGILVLLFFIITKEGNSQIKEEKLETYPILLNYVKYEHLLDTNGIEEWWNWFWKRGEVFTLITPLRWFSIRSRWSIPLRRQEYFYYDNMNRDYEILPFGETRYRFECSLFYKFYMRKWTLETGFGYTHISLRGIFSKNLMDAPGAGFLIKKEVLRDLYLESGLSFYYNLGSSDIYSDQDRVMYSLIFPFGVRYYSKWVDIIGGYTFETYFFESIPRYYHLLFTGGYFNIF